VPVSWHDVMRVNINKHRIIYTKIPCRSESFGGEGFEVNKVSYTIFFRYLRYLDIFQRILYIVEAEITFKNWLENVDWKRSNLVGHFLI
jgi:hypothetical protein